MCSHICYDTESLGNRLVFTPNKLLTMVEVMLYIWIHNQLTWSIGTNVVGGIVSAPAAELVQGLILML